MVSRFLFPRKLETKNLLRHKRTDNKVKAQLVHQVCPNLSETGEATCFFLGSTGFQFPLVNFFERLLSYHTRITAIIVTFNHFFYTDYNWNTVQM